VVSYPDVFVWNHSAGGQKLPDRAQLLPYHFIETDFVFRFDRPPDGRATNPFTFNMVFGLAF
jgi:hypothetical protein